jgi:hypothetical protein
MHPGARFITELFGASSTHPVYISSLPNVRGAHLGERHLITRDASAIEVWAKHWDRPGRAVYFAVNTIRLGEARRAKDTIAEITTLHTDIDFKSVVATPEEIEKILREVAMLPSKVVHSGNGLHAYWHLRESIPATPENVARVEMMLRWLARHLGGDPAVCEVSRLMRLPGSHNTKEGAWTEVKIIEDRPLRYDLDELEEWLSNTSPLIERKPTADGNGASGAASASDSNPFLNFADQADTKAPIDVAARLAVMQFQGAGETAIHTTQLACTAALLNRGIPVDEVVDSILQATRVAADDEGARWNWNREEADLRDMCVSWLEKHPDVVPHPKAGNCESNAPELLLATPHVWRVGADIAPREFLFRRHFIRNYVSVTVAPGGIGKSTLELAEVIAMTTGKAFLGESPPRPLRVWYYGEDPMDELDRRIAAICQHYKIEKSDLGDRLFINSRHDRSLKGFAIPGKGGSSVVFDPKLVAGITTSIARNGIDVAIFDPLVALHSCPENDNPAMDAIVRKIGDIGAATKSAIELVHHARKPATGQTETSVDDARGARAIIDAARAARVCNKMTAKEAQDAGIETAKRWKYVRIDNGKANLSPPDLATWLMLASVDLANGDNVGVAQPWDYPAAFDGISPTVMHWIRDIVRTKPDYLYSPKAGARWIGVPLADHLELNHNDPAVQTKLKAVLKTWLEKGVIATQQRVDPESRKKRLFVILGNWNEDEDESAPMWKQNGAKRRKRRIGSGLRRCAVAPSSYRTAKRSGADLGGDGRRKSKRKWRRIGAERTRLDGDEKGVGTTDALATKARADEPTHEFSPRLVGEG